MVFFFFFYRFFLCQRCFLWAFLQRLCRQHFHLHCFLLPGLVQGPHQWPRYLPRQQQFQLLSQIQCCWFHLHHLQQQLKLGGKAPGEILTLPQNDIGPNQDCASIPYSQLINSVIYSIYHICSCFNFHSLITSLGNNTDSRYQQGLCDRNGPKN